MQNNPNEHKDFQSLFEQIKVDLSSYIEMRLNYFKLRSYEKMSMTGSFVGYSLIISLLLFNIYTLVLLALGCFIGEYLHSYALGFLVLILISCLILVLIMLNAKKVRRYFVNLIIAIIKKIEKNEE